MEPISLSDTEEIEEEIVTNMEELPVVKSEPLEVEVNNVNDIQALFNPDDIPTPKENTDQEDLNLKLEAFEKERGELTAEVMTKDSLIGKLEKESSSLKAEIAQLETSHANAIAEHERKFIQLSEEMAAKVAELKKQYINANKEKESMVMKYALNEKEIIIQKKHREKAEETMKAAVKEKDEAVNKAKNAIADKLKLQQLADSRLQDSNVLKKEIDRWKEEVKIQEAKGSLNASKLKSEMEAHQETKEKLDKTIAHLKDTRSEIDQTRQECVDFMKQLKEDEKRQKAAEQEQSVKLMIDAQAASELENIKEKYQKTIEDNEIMTEKIKVLDKEKEEQEQNVIKLKDTIEVQKRKIDDLMAQAAEIESLKMQLSTENEKLENNESQIQVLKTDNQELAIDMAACQKKESELLEFTQKLTDTNVTLQSDLAFAEGRASALESEHTRLSNQVAELETSNGQLRIELDSECKNRKSETETLAKKLADSLKQLETAKQKVLDADNEVSVLKRKNQASLRELTRELKECQRRLEHSQTQNHLRISSPSGLSQSSRASSNTSLNKMPSNGEDSSTSSTVSCGSNVSLPSQEHYSNNGIKSVVNPQIQITTLPANVPDSQVLVEKIVRLQKEMAKRQEKLDFMEEHVNTMVEEMKKKNKLLQNLMLKQDSGALVSTDMDTDKRRTSEHTGIMSSLYSSKPNDSGMTLELSLEINQKLQSVLEDTLLKNFTLKENINTLGREIATLTTDSHPA